MSIQLRVSTWRRHHQDSFSEYFKGNIQKRMHWDLISSNAILYIRFDDLAKPEHVAVLIFYKKLCSMVICAFIYFLMIKTLFVFCTQIFKYNLPVTLLKVLTDQPLHFRTAFAPKLNEDVFLVSTRRHENVRGCGENLWNSFVRPSYTDTITDETLRRVYLYHK